MSRGFFVADIPPFIRREKSLNLAGVSFAYCINFAFGFWYINNAITFPGNLLYAVLHSALKEMLGIY